MYRFILNRLASLFVAALVIMLFLVQGCVRAATSTSSSPYGQSSYRQVCVAGNCRMVSDQTTVATVDTTGYERCVINFQRDNGRALQCGGGEGCPPYYSHMQVMDACTLRSGPLNGTQFGTMPFGQFMPLFTAGYFGVTAAYDAQRQSVLSGPRVPNLPPASQTPAGMSDQQLEDELLRREAARQADER